MRHQITKLIGWSIFASFLAVFLGFLGLCVAPYLPFMALVGAISIVSKNENLKPSSLPRWQVKIIILICLPLLIMAIVAPLRSLAVLAGEMPHLKKLGVDAYASSAPFRGLFGLPVAAPKYWDAAMGLIGLVFAVGGGFLDGFWRLKVAHAIAGHPTSTIRSIALGLAEVKGRVRREETDPNVSDVVLKFDGAKQTLTPFYLEDETGLILVDPEGAKIRSRDIFRFGGIFHEIVLTRHGKDFSRLGTAGSGELKVGDMAYVIGYVERNPLADAKAPYVIHAKKEKSLFFDVRNVFFMADTSEFNARHEIFRGMWSVWGVALAWASLSLTLIFMALPSSFS